jgi:hypothetical protein
MREQYGGQHITRWVCPTAVSGMSRASPAPQKLVSFCSYPLVEFICRWAYRLGPIKHLGEFLENASKYFDQVSVVYGDRLPK